MSLLGKALLCCFGGGARRFDVAKVASFMPLVSAWNQLWTGLDGPN